MEYHRGKRSLQLSFSFLSWNYTLTWRLVKRLKERGKTRILRAIELPLQVILSKLWYRNEYGIEKKGNRGGGGEEESQHFLTISRCSNAQRWNRGVGSIANGAVTSRIRNTKRVLRRSLFEKKRRYEFRSRTADRGVPLYGAWPPNLNVSTATTIRNTGSLDKRRLNRAHRFSFVFESMLLLTTAARVSCSTCSVPTNLDTIVCYVQKNRYGRRWYSIEPTSEHGDVRS